MTAKRVVALLLAALGVYFALIGYRAIFVLQQHKLTLQLLGGAVLVLPVIGLVLVGFEIRFGLATQRLARRLDDEDAPPEPLAPRTGSRRVDRDAADLVFEQRRALVLCAPEDWHGWYLLALAYDDSGDRKRARAAMRTAIEQAGP